MWHRPKAASANTDTASGGCPRSSRSPRRARKASPRASRSRGRPPPPFLCHRRMRGDRGAQRGHRVVRVRGAPDRRNAGCPPGSHFCGSGRRREGAGRRRAGHRVDRIAEAMRARPRGHLVVSVTRQRGDAVPYRNHLRARRSRRLSARRERPRAARDREQGARPRGAGGPARRGEGLLPEGARRRGARPGARRLDVDASTATGA